MRELKEELVACAHDLAMLDGTRPRAATAAGALAPRQTPGGGAERRLVVHVRAGQEASVGQGAACAGGQPSLAELRAKMDALRLRQEPFLRTNEA